MVSLLRMGLFGGEPLPESFSLGADDWQRLFDESRRQAVTALIYDAILMLPKSQRPPRQQLFHFTSMTQTISSDNIKREEALRKFAALVGDQLSKPTVVVKGSSLASLYPEPRHRECGDNDLYTGTATDAVEKLMSDMGIAVDSDSDPRHSAFVFDDVDFECHRTLLYHNDDPQWTPEPLDGDLCHLSPAGEAFFLAKHMEHHAVFFNTPVRLRDLVDWALLVSSPHFDYDALSELKRGSDVELFADMLTAYCHELFGVSTPAPVSLPKPLKTDDFRTLYMQCPERHRCAAVRVARRGWKYLRHWRKYKSIYGMSMFSRFYLHNVKVAIKQKFR